MAVMEHAYYASFGYQVTSFFAASRSAENHHVTLKSFSRVVYVILLCFCIT